MVTFIAWEKRENWIWYTFENHLQNILWGRDLIKLFFFIHVTKKQFIFPLNSLKGFKILHAFAFVEMSVRPDKVYDDLKINAEAL